MKTSDALKLAGIVAAGVAVYLVVTRTIKAGGDIAAGVKKVVSEDLNPASTKNVVTTALQSTPTGASIHEKIGDFLGSVFDPEGYRKMQSANASLHPDGGASNTATQNRGLTGAAADDVRERERQELRRMEGAYSSYNNPLAGITTLTLEQPISEGFLQ